MNHQLQVSNENEDKSPSSSVQDEKKEEQSFQENAQENQHLQQWANYFTPPSASLVTKHQNNTQCHPSYKEETKKVSLKLKPKRAKQDVMEVHGGRIVRATGRKDRHSKVSTAAGPKDRRVRLSPNTAIQFYDVQDRLGYDRPSKAIDWLIKEAQKAIDALEKNPFQIFSSKSDSTNKALNWQNSENEESQFTLEQSWSAYKKTELEELARHSSKLNATMHYSADQFPKEGYKEQSSKVCQQDGKIHNDSQIGNLGLFSSANDAKIQSFCEFQTYQQRLFHSETKKQPTNDAKIQSFCELQSYPQGHFHSETKKQPTNDAKIQSFCELQSYPQGHFHSETKKQPTNDAKIQSFCELQSYLQGHFHSETKKQPTKDAKMHSFCELQAYPQGHFHTEAKKQSANDAKIQSFCELQTYQPGHFHSETKKQSTNDSKIQSFCELQTYPQGHFHSETKIQTAQLGSFFNFQSSHQNESINFCGDHHQGLLNKTNLESREDSTFSFLPHNYPSILCHNQLFNYQREPLQSSSNFPQTISYSNIGFANDGLLGISNAPIIQQEEEHGTLSSTISSINATTLLHYQV